MAQDPYGFPAAPAGSVAAPAAGSPEAMQALWCGMSSAICASIGLCACYAPYFVGAPLGFYGMWKAMKAMEGALDARDRSVAIAGMVSGLLGGGVCALWAFFIVAYALFLVLYMVLVFVALGIAAIAEGQ